MYLVSDDYGDFKELMNRKELQELLINEIVTDTKENYTEYDIVKTNVEQLGSIAKNNLLTDEYLFDNLEGYGWYVINILDIQKGINDLREYWCKKHTDTKVFDDLLKFIDEDLKKD